MKMKKEKCPVCKGKGVIKDSFHSVGKVCKVCEGTGKTKDKSLLQRFTEYTVLI